MYANVSSREQTDPSLRGRRPRHSAFLGVLVSTEPSAQLLRLPAHVTAPLDEFVLAVNVDAPKCLELPLNERLHDAPPASLAAKRLKSPVPNEASFRQRLVKHDRAAGTPREQPFRRCARTAEAKRDDALDRLRRVV